MFGRAFQNEVMFLQKCVPNHLKIKGRGKDQNFNDSDLLYRGFELSEYDSIEETISLAAISFPDFSCNWSRYSVAKDIRYRMNGQPTDGCYSFSVVDSRYNNAAEPVHDPLDDPKHPNYAHTEIRATRQTDEVSFIPPKGRKMTKGKKTSLQTKYSEQS